MHSASLSPPRAAPWHPAIQWMAGALFVLLALLLLVPTGAHAAPPPAGASISNQASATYSDGSGVGRLVTSNLVQTTVTQVYALTLTAPGTQSATPGSVVYFPHTLTNTGNGSDNFRLTTSQTTSPAFTNIEIYADNGSGAPTGAAIPATQNITVTAGSTFKFIVRATVPTTAVAGDSNTITVTATSQGDTSKTASNADLTNVTGNAVIQLGKAVSVASGAPGIATVEYTLTYTNNGNSTATNVRIADQLPLGMTMNATSGRWSVTGTGVQLSGNGGSVGTAPNTLVSTYTAATRTFEATIASVAPGQSGWIRITVTVGANVPPGVLTNFATAGYNTGGTPATATSTSNYVDFTVLQTANVTFTGATVTGPAAPGSTVSFTNLLTNTGNGTDTFNVTVGTSTFPAGTQFQLYKSDGTTPLVDTNSDGIPDTGPIANGGTYNVILLATLPPNATAPGAVTVQKTARSIFDNTKSATATDTLSQITPSSADLTNNAAAAAGVPGFGVFANGETLPQVTNNSNPGTTTVFTLFANNTGPSPDTYNFTAGQTGAMGALPTGWSVEFRAGTAGSCTTMGATVTNTGTIAANGNAVFCAVVTVPAGYDAGDVEVYFRMVSPTSGVADVLHDRVRVNAVRLISLTPNGTGQTYPGGSFVYAHTLTNNGNVAEGGALSTLTPAVPASGGWSSTLYIDSNNDGQLDAADALINGALAGTLAKGASITVFHRVIAPAGAVPGTVYPATITVTTVNGSYTTTVPAPAVATDSTTVIAGNLTLAKVQALDANCDGTADGGAASFGQGNLNARPGQCVLYKVTVTNVGAADATSVVVSDATPTYTTLSTAPAIESGPAGSTIVTPAVALGATGTIKAHIGTGATNLVGGTLPAGQSAVITFGVKIAD